MRSKAWHELWVFGLKQARACIFAGAFFLLLFLSHKLPLGPIHRYDFLFVSALVIQIVLYLTKIETKDEIKTIALFHLLGLALELFKTSPQIGGWSYPEAGFFKIATVPLYSGFMYAAVGSYISQAWRLMQLKLVGTVRTFPSTILACAIYLNFFTNEFLPDARWMLIPLVFAVFWGVSVEFTITKRAYRMPISLSFFLIAFFIWIAENISTYFAAWKYPEQLDGWNIVSFKIISSWYLLVIISFILVANLKQLKAGKTALTKPVS
ncbi:DUF817 domain-containing protein [Patescibacteria group bacterium]|nr:DUF817 domain-containing protein [Patescibacteria group bacterium]